MTPKGCVRIPPRNRRVSARRKRVSGVNESFLDAQYMAPHFEVIIFRDADFFVCALIIIVFISNIVAVEIRANNSDIP